MFILKLLRPSTIPVDKADWGIRIKAYYWLLCRLMPLYRSGMVNEIIEIDDVSVIHNVRDFGYENELLRFNVVFTEHLVTNKGSYYLQKCNYKRYHCFNWTESFVVKHSKNLDVKTDIHNVFNASNIDRMQCTNKHKIHVKETIQEVITPVNNHELENKHKAGFVLNDIF